MANDMGRALQDAYRKMFGREEPPAQQGGETLKDKIDMVKGKQEDLNAALLRQEAMLRAGSWTSANNPYVNRGPLGSPMGVSQGSHIPWPVQTTTQTAMPGSWTARVQQPASYSLSLTDLEFRPVFDEDRGLYAIITHPLGHVHVSVMGKKALVDLAKKALAVAAQLDDLD